MSGHECIGELRQSETGNVFRLHAIDGDYRVVERLHNAPGQGCQVPRPDLYRWHKSQWASVNRYSARR